MTRSLLLALALARAVALLDSPETPGLRGTISEAAEPAGQYSVRSTPKELKDFMLTDCPPMPGCEPEDYYTSCYDKCLAVGYTEDFCQDVNVGCDQTKANCFGGNACSTTATVQQCLDAAGGHDAQKGPCNY